MSGIFKASMSAFAILGCAAVIMLGTLVAFWGHTILKNGGEGESLGYVLVPSGAVVAIGGGLSFHLLLRRPRRELQLEDEGW